MRAQTRLWHVPCCTPGAVLWMGILYTQHVHQAAPLDNPALQRCLLEGRFLQVDTFTAKRYSLHWINWVDQDTHTMKPAKDTANKTILQKKVYIKAVDSPCRVVDHVGGPHKFLTLIILLALQLTLGQGVQQLCMMYRYSSVSSFFNTYSHQKDVNLAATYNMQSSAADLSAWLRLLSMMQERNTPRVLHY